MASQIRIGPSGGPKVIIDEVSGNLELDPPSGTIDLQSNTIANGDVAFGISTPATDTDAAYGAVVLADASGGPLTVTLPAPAAGQAVNVKKIDSSANAVTVATPNTETIDGQTSISIVSQFAAREVVSDGSDYFII
jgi:hypothetical protein